MTDEVFCCLELFGCISVYISDVAKCIIGAQNILDSIYTATPSVKWANMRFVVCLHIKNALA